MKKPESHILVIFGASGDLTKRKLIPALYQLFSQKFLPDNFAVIGVSRTQMDDDKFREKTSDSLKKLNFNDTKEFLQKIFYVSLETSDANAYSPLKKKIEEVEKKFKVISNYIFYMATPPDLFEIIPKALKNIGISHENGGWRRLIVEKPFGRDLASAENLNKQLLNCFREDQIYRIDHYLGKETVQNIMVTRFSNGIFEPLWNRNYINHVEITSAENIGVENRGGYYDHSGALRDMVQNHLMQLLALVAMEPPTVINSSSIRNEVLKVFQSARKIRRDEVANHVIRGQYIESRVRGELIKSYRDEEGVRKDSKTETFVAMKIFIDNWRWGGVPFYIRTGKRLPTRVTEVVIHFKPTPNTLFCFDSDSFNSDNQLVIRIQPDEGILLKIGMKVPGTGFNVRDVNMDFHYSDLGKEPIAEAYQRLLIDCMQGDSTLYTRGDAILQAWKFLNPVLEVWETNPEIPVHGYPAGTWGPINADSLIEGEKMAWRYPCKNLTDDGNYCEL